MQKFTMDSALEITFTAFGNPSRMICRSISALVHGMVKIVSMLWIAVVLQRRTRGADGYSRIGRACYPS